MNNYFYFLKTVDGLMNLMDIQNPNEVREYFEQMDNRQRVSTSLTMIFWTSKFYFIGFLGNIGMIIMFIPASWEVIKENKRKKEINDRLFLMRTVSSSIDQAPPVNA